MEGIELKYEFRPPRGDVNIKTPFGDQFKFTDIKQIFIEHTDKIIKRLSIYPNGFVIYIEQTAFNVIMRTNWPIQQDRFGEFVVIEPK